MYLTRPNYALVTKVFLTLQMFPPPLSLNFPRQKTTMVHFTQLKNKIKPKPATLLVKPIF